MKILFSSNKNPLFLSISDYVEDALRSNGETVFFNDRSFIVPARLRKTLPALQEFDLRQINGRLCRLVRALKPQVLLQTGGQRILPHSLAHARAQGTCTALWTIDPPVSFDRIRDIAPHFDFVFAGGSEAYELLAGAGVRSLHWLPFACDPRYHVPIQMQEPERAQYASDIVFVGSYYPNRFRLFEELSDLDIGIWGPGWDKVPHTSALRKRIKKASGVKPQEWVKIYAGAKIVLACHYQDGVTPCYQASPKVYEAMACRRLLLSDPQADVLRQFAPGVHLDIFSDARNLREKIRQYLDSPDDRERIARQGYENVLKNHTYACRIETMLSIMKKGGCHGPNAAV